MKCLFTKNLITPKLLPKQWADLNHISFPEKEMSVIEQREFNPENYDEDFIITNSPFIVSCFRSNNILILDENETYRHPYDEVYGCSFEVVLKSLHGLKSCLPSIVVEDIREHLNDDDSVALKYIETIGSSAEKAYLVRKLHTK